MDNRYRSPVDPKHRVHLVFLGLLVLLELPAETQFNQRSEMKPAALGAAGGSDPPSGRQVLFFHLDPVHRGTARMLWF